MMRRIGVLGVVAGLLLVPAGAAGPDAPPPKPLLGANFIRYWERPPNCGGPSVLLKYQISSVRDIVRNQLAAMRAAGLSTLRLFIYHATNIRGDEYGLISSAGGRLAEPYRTNLAQFLDDVRAAGFSSTTVTFNPWYENDPIGYTPYPYKPALLAENAAFIADIRPIIKAHGPPTTRIDLINEGAPDDWQPELRDYVSEMWKRYADAFGTGDVLVSIIVKSDEGGSTSRLENLIALLRATGRGLPTVFQVHPSWSGSGALRDLRAIDAVLAREGLSQPLVIGEEAYNSEGAAAGIAAFLRETQRPVLEIMEWPLETPGTRWTRCPSAPYRVDAFMRALGRTPLRLNGRVDPHGPQLTSSGVAVTALGAGRYQVVATDRSKRDGFRLFVGDRRLQTGARYRGTARWTVRLDEGGFMRYGSIRRGARKLVPVLGNGFDH
jgi:hypothetical protein